MSKKIKNFLIFNESGCCSWFIFMQKRSSKTIKFDTCSVGIRDEGKLENIPNPIKQGSCLFNTKL